MHRAHLVVTGPQSCLWVSVRLDASEAGLYSRLGGAIVAGESLRFGRKCSGMKAAMNSSVDRSRALLFADSPNWDLLATVTLRSLGHHGAVDKNGLSMHLRVRLVHRHPRSRLDRQFQ